MHIFEPKVVFQRHDAIQGPHPTTNKMLWTRHKVPTIRGSQSGEFIHYHFQGCSIHEVTLEVVEEGQMEKDEEKEDEDEDDDGTS